MPSLLNTSGLLELITSLGKASAATAIVTKSNSDISKKLSKIAKSAAPGKTSKSIRAKSNFHEIGLTIGSNPPYSIGTFFGANRRFGWYAASKFSGSGAKQFKPWVGQNWTPGEETDKPYHIGSPLNAATPEVINEIADTILSIVFATKSNKS